ncbi:MAG: ferritin-like domain-containing protein [Parachlamydia sp.]|nr:ferritin-like domain-containing protein [Parachlamydia sp.]
MPFLLTSSFPINNVELREWAASILEADTLDGKLASLESPTDDLPGDPLIFGDPVRPPGMSFSKRKKEEKLPPFNDLHDPEKRAICLHRFAGHELLAVEIMAFTLLAFPHAPKHFRKGLANTLCEEQRHVRLYMQQMSRLGVQFGDLPLYRHFWKHTPFIASPLHYVSTMSLTFEMANLDFAPMYGKTFLKYGDEEAAALMATILRDEIAHVGFGWGWLKRFKSAHETEWEAWENTLSSTLLNPKRAKGFVVHEDHRSKAGIPEEWIIKLKQL